MTARGWLFAATALTAVAAGVGLPSLSNPKTRLPPGTTALLAFAFLFESIFLYQEGKTVGHCPITTLGEVSAFLAWSFLLTHLVIGPIYHVSVLGLFTAPVVTVFNLAALVLPWDRARPLPKVGPVLEFHATVALLAYGVLGLAAIASFLFLVQEHELKHYRLGLWLFRLPSLGELMVIQRRLLAFGFVLLSLGIGLGFWISTQGQWDWVKVAWSGLVWLVYFFLVLAPRTVRWSCHQMALASLVSYLFILLTFWGINSLSQNHRFL
ncbi:cytochrome C assembly family protein [Candidatus Methylacidithermus pantelleriae]|uniref:HemX protein, negative effector of steady-state concentration of glutamyl-tRNA reductase n=1 Tax=Candidatus Methylacidithermus pantelleriae TaxID=2744239 RepID=A0A8J2BPA6_9BACT|nr:cytochrome c biogenesis protein CcsA [Candidatus Methylacidithermus pantelleriae]CAF0696062.1 HemX protein, negative effector of steady-state concentration of glutamyl-tRNA reductase [Candidatus Methylacidithermus pantelleriae]